MACEGDGPVLCVGRSDIVLRADMTEKPLDRAIE